MGKIIDRVEEGKLIKKALDKNKIIVVYSKTGVGKSSIIKRLLRNLDVDNYITLFCNNYRSNEKKITKEGNYIENLFREVVKKTKEDDVLDFNVFLHSIENYDFLIDKKRFNEKFAEKTSLIFNKMFNLNQLLEWDDIYLYLNMEHIDDFKIINRYLSYVFSSEKKMIVSIDNMQNIDEKSYRLLCDIIRDSSNYIKFIFEYTILGNELSIAKFIDNLQNSTDISAYEFFLENLDTSHASKVAKQYHTVNKEIKNNENIIHKHYHEISDGNLYELRDFVKEYNENTNKEINSLINSLNNLSNNELLILAAIINSESKINENLLFNLINKILNSIDENAFTTIIKTLESKEYIIKQDNNIEIYHSSLTDSWKKFHHRRKYDLLIYDNYSKLLKNYLDNNDFNLLDKSSIIIELLRIYSIYMPEKIKDLLNEVDKVIFIIKPKLIWQYLKKFVDSLYNLNYRKADLYLKVYNLCQEMDYSNGCVYVINKIYDNINDKIIDLYKALSFILIEDFEKAYSFIEIKLNDCDDDRMVLYYYLFKMIIFRLSDKFEHSSCDNVAKLIENNDSFKKYPEYGYLLRFSEMTKDKYEAIKDVEQSIIWFNKFSELKQVEKSKHSLVHLYAVCGKFKKALEVDESNNIILNNSISKSIQNINHSAISLYQKKGDEEIFEDLKFAENMCNSIFNKLLIFNNQLVWCLVNEDITRGNSISKKILKIISSEADGQIKAISYYNVSRYYNMLGNIDFEKKYYKLALKYKEFCPSLKTRLDNDIEKHEYFETILKNDWHVCFQSYWYIDILI